jgi:hypothetical protein
VLTDGDGLQHNNGKEIDVMAVWNGRGSQDCDYCDSRATKVNISRENGQISDVTQACNTHAAQFPPKDFITDERGAYVGHDPNYGK